MELDQLRPSTDHLAVIHGPSLLVSIDTLPALQARLTLFTRKHSDKVGSYHLIADIE